MKTIILTLSIISLLTVSSCAEKIGPAGPTGAKGEQGSVGPRGIPGVDGADAIPCAVTLVAPSSLAPAGGSLITCPDTSALVLNGTNGTNGTNGSAGTPGTVITLVKLCPGTTVYPSKFVEVAACINNELVGVYSANGGFLTELPAGTYGSNGINASCNFVIGANCTVTN